MPVWPVEDPAQHPSSGDTNLIVLIVVSTLRKTILNVAHPSSLFSPVNYFKFYKSEYFI